MVQNASIADGAPAVTAHDQALGNGTNDDEWQFTPTTSGYYRLVNANSGLSLAVQNASTAAGAPIVQAIYSNGTGNDEWLIEHTANGTYNFINRLSNLLLDVPEHTGKPGIQLDQAQPGTCANQQFRLIEDAPPPALAPVGASQQNAAANCR